MRERAMDGLEAFRVNRLCSEAIRYTSGKWVRLFESDPSYLDRPCSGEF